MADACSIAEYRSKAAASYTDEEADRYAAEVGIKARPMETKNEIDERGAFIRQPNAFIRPFGDGPDDIRADKDRFCIFWMKGCNWSNRPVIVRDILGLGDVISDRLTTPSGQSNKYGHAFGDAPGRRDPATGAYFLSEFYKNADPDYKGRATTPTMVDIVEKKAVNNDYHRLTNYIEVWFRAFQPKDAPDLYPVRFRREIDEFNDWLFPHINNGHYRMAFCQSVEAYDEAFDDFYDSMDKIEKRLSENRFLFGDYITDSDVRLFVSLIRWDISYYRNVGPVKHRMMDYPAVWGYIRELYNIPAFKKNTYVRDLALRNVKADKDKEIFTDYQSRIAPQIDYDKLLADDGSRRALSDHPDEIYLRHPADETVEDYLSEISYSHWNSTDPADRDPSDPANSPLSVDASINPLKGLL